MVLTKKHKDLWLGDFFSSQSPSILMWLDDPAIPGNVIESANRVSEWTGEIGGINADQTTALDQPLRVGSEIRFDGSNEFFTLPDLFSIASGDTQGEVFIVLKTGGSGVSGAEFGVADAATTNNNFLVRINAAVGHIIEIFHTVGGSNDQIKGDTDIGDDTSALINFSSNGIRWRLGLNGSEETFVVTSGDNTGGWIGDIPGVDNIRLSSLGDSTPIFEVGKLFSVVYSNVELSSVNRTSINSFLNARFNIF